MKTLKRFEGGLLVAVCLGLLMSGPVGCGTLAPGGAYQDKALYEADMTIATSYELIHSFVSWEYENRDGLAGTPEIKLAADRVRAGAPNWFATALALRDAYANSPNDGTRTALSASLEVLRAAVREATRYLTQQNLKR